jgi:hypothetical protein
MNIHRTAILGSHLFHILACGAIVHSALLFAWWLTSRFDGPFFVSGRTWIVLAWLWAVWPLVLLLHPGASLRRRFIVIGIGLALLVPCAETILIFSCWKIGGFAP